MAEVFRSLYSIIPASVRDDKALRPNAKLLYGELSALCQSEGYCWAKNAYLAAIFELSPKTIEGLLKQLCDGGHIRREVELDADTNAVISRKIWIIGPPGICVPPPLNIKGRYPQNKGDPPLKIEGENINNIILTNKETPIVPQVGESERPVRKKKSKDTSQPKYQPEWFERFWAKYPRHTNKLATIRAWDKLKPSLELCSIMSKALEPDNWPESWSRDDGRFIMHPSTWLNGSRWEDKDAKISKADKSTAPNPTFKTVMIDGHEVDVYD